MSAYETAASLIEEHGSRRTALRTSHTELARARSNKDQAFWSDVAADIEVADFPGLLTAEVA